MIKSLLDPKLGRRVRRPAILLLLGLISAPVLARQRGDGDLPPVLLVTNGYIREGAWVYDNTVQERRFDTAGAVPSIDWAKRIDMIQTESHGRLFGFAQMSVKGRYGKIESSLTVQLGYQHYGGWPIFISTLSGGQSTALYVKGDYGTPYGFKASATSYYMPGPDQSVGFNSTAWGWAHPGANFYWRESDADRNYQGSGLTDAAYGPRITYKGQVYTPTNPTPDYSAGSGYGNSGPGQGPFLVSGQGTYNFTVEAWLNQGQPPFVAFIPPDGLRTGSVSVIKSLSYDPDNPGAAPHKGIVQDEWDVSGPGGFTDHYEGRDYTFLPPVAGAYRIKLTSKDDEGMSGTFSREVEVTQARPDLRVSNLIYHVINSQRPGRAYLPIAANGQIVVQFDLENTGKDATPPERAVRVGLFLSEDREIDQGDTSLGLVESPAPIASGGSQHFVKVIDMTPFLLEAFASGERTLGTIADPYREIDDANRKDNANRDRQNVQMVLSTFPDYSEFGFVGSDRVTFYVYDPIAPTVKATPNPILPVVAFPTYDAAAGGLARGGFRPAFFEPGGEAWELPSNSPAWSYYFGEFLPGEYWRTHAHIRGDASTGYALWTQARTTRYPYGEGIVHGEPMPTLSIGDLGYLWRRYAKLWHEAY